MGLIAGGMYVFARLSGLLIAMPVLGASGVPAWARLAIAFPLTLLLLPVATATPLPATLSALLGAVILEAVAGLLIGFVMQVAYSSLGITAELAATQAGLSVAALFDPVMASSNAALGQLMTWLGAGVFLGAGAHRHVLGLLAGSFETLPPGQVHVGDAPSVLVDLVGTSLATGVQLAGPLTLFVFLVNAAMSVVGRMAPGQPIFFAIGTTFQTVFCIALVAVVLPVVLRGWMGAQDAAFDAIVDLFRTLAG